jgi:hypothetical protein
MIVKNMNVYFLSIFGSLFEYNAPFDEIVFYDPWAT